MIRDDWYTNIYDSELALKLENVNKYFEISKSGVTDVSFEVKKNEVFGLVGNNGCGKSTIINMIAGIQRP
jgi:ABC-type multidrug transport system ATPase subunit